jgi:hypothetical protein
VTEKDDRRRFRQANAGSLGVPSALMAHRHMKSGESSLRAPDGFVHRIICSCGEAFTSKTRASAAHAKAAAVKLFGLHVNRTQYH